MKKNTVLLFLLFHVIYGLTAQEIANWKIQDFEKHLNSNPDQVVVINFWATFCKPCIAELPGMMHVVEKYSNQQVKLTLVSMDLKTQYPGKIKDFLKSQGFKGDAAWLNETNADYFCPKVDTTWSGSIPATLIVNNKTGKRGFYEGEMTELEFEAFLKKML